MHPLIYEKNVGSSTFSWMHFNRERFVTTLKPGGGRRWVRSFLDRVWIIINLIFLEKHQLKKERVCVFARENNSSNFILFSIANQLHSMCELIFMLLMRKGSLTCFVRFAHLDYERCGII